MHWKYHVEKNFIHPTLSCPWWAYPLPIRPPIKDGWCKGVSSVEANLGLGCTEYSVKPDETGRSVPFSVEGFGTFPADNAVCRGTKAPRALQNLARRNALRGRVSESFVITTRGTRVKSSSIAFSWAGKRRQPPATVAVRAVSWRMGCAENTSEFPRLWI